MFTKNIFWVNFTNDPDNLKFLHYRAITHYTQENNILNNIDDLECLSFP